MSDGLVDRVARAIADSAPSFSGTVGDCDPAMFKDEARAAIAAVAEWLAQSEDRECNPLQAIAAALRAAAGGGEK